MSEARVRTVLIVDNDKGVRDTLAKLVEHMGYRAVAVDRVTRALPILRDGQADAMLLDLHMPGPHGDHLLSFLKRNQIPAPPTIVVSGYLAQERIGPLIELGVCGIVAKPFDVKRLMDELRAVVEGEGQPRLYHCPQCGKASRREARFCRNCGASLQRQNTCPSCNTRCEPGDRFCGSCGTALGKDRGHADGV